MVRAYLNVLSLALCAALICLAGCAQEDNFAADYAEAYGSDSHATAGTRGDYWYFDRSRSRGTRSTSGVLDPVTGLVAETSDSLSQAVEPVADVLNAPLIPRIVDSKWYFDKGALIDKLKAFYAEGEKTDLKFSPLGVVIPPKGSLSYVEVKLRGDGSKWYFDRSGNWLPKGYTPEVSLSFSEGFVSVRSSDLFDQLIVQFTDGREKSFGGRLFFGTFPTGQPVRGVMVRLRSDGSKWYFDNTGTPVPCGDKWFEDVD